MIAPSAEPRLRDIVEAIGYIRSDMENITLDSFAGDRGKRWQVERGLEIVSEASRHLPEDLKARHPEIPWRKVAGIGNVLHHEYTRVAADAIWRLVRDDLAELDQVCRAELAACHPICDRRARWDGYLPVSSLRIPAVTEPSAATRSSGPQMCTLAPSLPGACPGREFGRTVSYASGTPAPCAASPG
jgi:uncharacterized protein with HEPN domain